MHFPTLSVVNLTRALAVLGGLLAVLLVVGHRKQRRMKWMRWYLALCLGFSSMLYFLPSRFSSTQSYHWMDLTALFIYSLLECWLIFLFLLNEPMPPTRRRALDIAYSVFFYFWLIVFLGTPRFILADTATMMAAEALTVTVLTVIGLEATFNNSSFTHFMRSNAFTALLGILGYFSFSIPVFLLLMLLESHTHPNILLTQTSELFTYAGFFLMIRKDYNALPLS